MPPTSGTARSMPRYRFDGVDFDTGLTRADRERAQQQAAAASRFGADDLEAARREGFARGHEAGQDAALVSLEHQIATALGQVSGQLGQLLAHSDAALVAAEALLLRGLTQVLTSGLPALAARGAVAEIEAAVAGVLPSLREEARLLLHVAPDLVAEVDSRVAERAQAAGYSGRLKVVADPAMAAGDCRLEWGGGGLERSLQPWLAAVAETLHRHAGQAPGDDAPALEFAEPPPAAPARPAAAASTPRQPLPAHDGAGAIPAQPRHPPVAEGAEEDEDGGAVELDLASLAADLIGT